MKRSLFNEYFSFSASEKRSIYIVSIFIFLIIIASVIIKHVPGKKFQYSKEELREIDSLVAMLSKEEESKKIFSDELKNTPKEFFYFDPNTASKEELVKLGFSTRQINTIRNYLAAGGKFYQNHDLKKIYNISEEQYILYEPYIQINAPNNSVSKTITIEEQFFAEENGSILNQNLNKEEEIELNSAKEYELMILKGIGEVFASRIIKYRELLGGYSHIDQLLEVYGINDSLLSQVDFKINIDTSYLRKIDLNAVSYEDLVKHPYLDSYNSKAILNYRKYVKKGISREDLLKDNVLPQETYNRIFIYLKP